VCLSNLGQTWTLLDFACSTSPMYVRTTLCSYLPDAIHGDLDSLRPEVRSFYTNDHGVPVLHCGDQVRCALLSWAGLGWAGLRSADVVVAHAMRKLSSAIWRYACF
jgi:hypothetical protein